MYSKVNDLKEKIYSNVNRVKKTHTTWFMLLFILLLWNINSNLSEYNKINKQNSLSISKNAQYVNYYDSSTGVLSKYKQERFDASREKYVVAKVLSDYLIQSAYNLTNDYESMYFKTPKDLFIKNKSLQEFYKHYIYYPTNTEKENLQYSQTVGDWDQIIKWYRLAIHNNDLPGIVDKKLSSIEFAHWKTRHEHFEISIEVPIYSTSRDNNNKIVSQKGIAVIQAEGFFNTLLFDEINPRGLKFTKLKINHPVVQHTQGR